MIVELAIGVALVLCIAFLWSFIEKLLDEDSVVNIVVHGLVIIAIIIIGLWALGRLALTIWKWLL